MGKLNPTPSTTATVEEWMGDVKVGLEESYEKSEGIMGGLTDARSDLIAAKSEMTSKIITILLKRRFL